MAMGIVRIVWPPAVIRGAATGRVRREHYDADAKSFVQSESASDAESAKKLAVAAAHALLQDTTAPSEWVLCKNWYQSE